MEIVGDKWRSTIAILYQIPFSLGICLMVGISYLQRDWRDFHFTLSAVSALFLVYWWWVKRCWLLFIYWYSDDSNKPKCNSELSWEQIKLGGGGWFISLFFPLLLMAVTMKLLVILWMFLSSVMWIRAVLLKFTKFKDPLASIIRVAVLTSIHFC
jgi:hypothetical protein